MSVSYNAMGLTEGEKAFREIKAKNLYIYFVLAKRLAEEKQKKAI